MAHASHRACSMRAVRTGLAWLAALVAGACSLSLDGGHFRGDRETDAGTPDPSDAPDPPDGEDEDAAETCGESCPGGDCDLACPERACDCELDCAATFKTCKPKCEHHDCAIDCRKVDKCAALCKDSDCTINCTGAEECDYVKCEGGSRCLLDCTGAETCEFDVCDGEVTSCPGDKLACNRGCP